MTGWESVEQPARNKTTSRGELAVSGQQLVAVAGGFSWPPTATQATDRSAIAAAHAVDLAAVSFRRAAGAAVSDGDRGLEGIVSFGRGRAVIVEAFGGGRGINSLGDEFGDVNDPLALVDACFHVTTHAHG